MSAQYWPVFVDKTEKYGDEFEVTMKDEEAYAHYRVSRGTQTQQLRV
jgi:hypothetical protein